MTYSLLILPLCTLLLYLRFPYSFANPQFWGEDANLFLDNHTQGLKALFLPLSGYLILLSRLFALTAGLFPLRLIPRLYHTFAIAITLVVAYLILQLPFPHTDLMALALVTVPAGIEVLVCLVNTQWIVPIALIAILLNPTAHLYDYPLTILIGLTGPFSIFLTPLALLTNRQDLALILAPCAIIQTAIIFYNPPLPAPAVPYHWKVWIVTPLTRFTEAFLPFSLAFYWLPTSLVALPFAIWLMPYPIIPAFLYALAVLYTGMLKYRHDLSRVYWQNQRYVYAGSIFFIWALCLYGFFYIPLLALTVSFITWLRYEKIRRDFHWSHYTADIAHGTATIPTAPHWQINLSPTNSFIQTDVHR